MRGGFLRVTTDLIFEFFCLKRGDIEIVNAMMDPEFPRTVRLFLTGADKRLPVIKEGERYPEMEVLMTLGKETLEPSVTGELMPREEYKRRKEKWK